MNERRTMQKHGNRRWKAAALVSALTAVMVCVAGCTAPQPLDLQIVNYMKEDMITPEELDR